MNDTKDANICIFIANLATWLRFNIDKDKFEQRNIYEGRCWSYSTIKDFQNYFSFWSIQNIRTIIKNCEKLGLIIISDFNKHKYDKTMWYTLTDKALEYYPILKDKINTRSHEDLINTDLLKLTNGFAKTNNAIPEDPNHMSLKRNNINIISKSGNEVNEQIVQVYHEEFPELAKYRKLDTRLTNQLNKMVKNWPKYQSDGNKFTIESFRLYMQFIKNQYPWVLKPYITAQGATKKNNLRTFTTETFICKIINEEFYIG